MPSSPAGTMQNILRNVFVRGAPGTDPSLFYVVSRNRTIWELSIKLKGLVFSICGCATTILILCAVQVCYPSHLRRGWFSICFMVLPGEGDPLTYPTNSEYYSAFTLTERLVSAASTRVADKICNSSSRALPLLLKLARMAISVET